MRLPILLVVDDDRDALDEVETQLVHRYAHDYRIESLGDPDDALRTLQELADAGEDVALVLAASSLLSTSGTHLLERVRQLHPHAGRALLVSGNVWWTDQPTADAIRDSMALGRIDYYLPRPAGSFDEVFHEAVSSFLLESARARRVVPQTVHIVGETWSGRAYELREVLEQCVAPHAFCLAASEQGRDLLARTDPDAKLPLMVFPDGEFLSDPSNAEIAAVVGGPAAMERDFDVVIVGSGPAGLSAAVSCASEGFRILVVDGGGIGGQARSSSLIRNYLGFAMGVSGSRLAEQAYEQAVAFGASFLFMHRATALARSGDRLSVSIEGGRRVSARAVILATGATYRRLDVPSLEILRGAGVFYGGPVSEAHALRGKDAYIAGGGNSAGQAALHLARYARHVTLVVRGSSLGAGMSHYLVQAVEATPNVQVRAGTTVVGGGGDGRLQQLVLRNSSGEEDTVAADALFVLIGARPHSDWLPPEIARDARGFLLTGADMDDRDWPLERKPLSLETSMPGVLAAGDVRHASVKRVASAVGAGAIAVQLVHSLFADEPPHLRTPTESTASAASS